MRQEEFLFEEDGNNHRPMLWFALELTKDSNLPVGEFGSGDGSTKWLRQYCLDAGRVFYSYDNNKEWGDRFGARYTNNWLDPNLYMDSSVVLIDQGPAEERHKSIELLANRCDIIVVHDVEPLNSNSYRLHLIWDLFKYRINLRGPKIWTAALSNKIDLTQYNTHLVGEFKLEI